MSKSKKYLVEFVLFFTYALFAMSWKSGDILIAKMGFTASQMAIMTNAINVAKIIGSLSAAGIIAKLGNRKVFSYSTLLIFLGILLPFVNEFPLIFLVRFTLGLGGALVLVTINPIVAKIFSKEELTIVNGLNAVAFNVGLAITLTLASSISSNPPLSIKIISFTLLVLVFLWNYLSSSIDQDTVAQSNPAHSFTFVDGLKDSFNWIFSLSYCGLLGFYLVSFTFMRAENVKYVIYFGVIGAIVGTIQAKKIENKLNFVRISAFLQLLSAIGFLLLYNTSVIKFMGMSLGFFIFLPMAAFVTLAFNRPDTTPRKISVTFSIFWSLSYFISIIIIQAFAFLKDNFGDSSAFIFIVFVEATFFIGTTFFMKNSKKISEDKVC